MKEKNNYLIWTLQSVVLDLPTRAATTGYDSVLIVFAAVVIQLSKLVYVKRSSCHKTIETNRKRVTKNLKMNRF